MNRTPLVLGIAGSPRRQGNSDRLLESALEGAREAGGQTRTLVASLLGLEACQGCNVCARTGECVLRDAGPAFYEAIDDADAIVVASPVFFAGVPSALKTVIDRLQPYWGRTYALGLPRPPRRPGAILLAGGGGDPYGMEPAEATLRSGLAVLDIDVLGVVIAIGADSATDLVSQPAVLAEARALGARVGAEAGRRLTAP